MAEYQGKGSHEWYLVDDVLVTYTVGEVQDAIWSRYLAAIQNDKIRINLAFSSNGSLTALQRKTASDALKAKNIPAVVVTDSALVRGVVTAMTWLGTNIRAFSFTDLDKAIQAVSTKPDAMQEIKTLTDRFMATHLKK